ncbi:hypothetical protein LTR08_005263 [Meristemomyces frigidus]|nr:hypothetical protein LTR08_005263 [Meristemomyces frigidus]
MAYGRGGAGNIQAVAQETARASADLEANEKPTQSDHVGPPEDNSAREEQQYAHTGRGGAGNYYSPKDLTKSGNFSDAHRSHILGDGTLPPATSMAADSGSAPPSYNTAQPSGETIRSYGRGGAGNYAFGAGEGDAARKKAQEEQIKERLQADIERSVEQSLAVPEKAKLPSG